MTQKKLNIISIALIYLFSLFGLALNHAHPVSFYSPSIAEHNCLGHKFHPSLKGEPACSACNFSALDVNEVQSSILQPLVPEFSIFEEPSLVSSPGFFNSNPKRAPPEI